MASPLTSPSEPTASFVSAHGSIPSTSSRGVRFSTSEAGSVTAMKRKSRLADDFDKFTSNEWSCAGLDWRIHHFSVHVAEGSQEPLESPIFGGRWQIKFFPNGHLLKRDQEPDDGIWKKPEPEGYCAVFVFPIQCQDEMKNVTDFALNHLTRDSFSQEWERNGRFICHFGVKEVDAFGKPGPLIWKPRTTAVREFNSKSGGWGYSNYIKHSELFDNRRVASTDSLVITCQIRTEDIPARPFWQKELAVSPDIMRGLSQLLLNPAADVVITCSGEDRLRKGSQDTDFFAPKKHSGTYSLYVHRAILSARCAYFERMFASGFVEGRDYKVSIEDFDFPTVYAFMKWIYTGTIDFKDYTPRDAEDGDMPMSPATFRTPGSFASPISPVIASPMAPTPMTGSDVSPTKAGFGISPRIFKTPSRAYALPIYILADKLNMDELKEVALNYIRIHLRTSTAFEDAIESDPWDELYMVIKEYILSQWSEVRSSRGFYRAMGRLEEYGDAGRRVVLDITSSLEYLGHEYGDLAELKEGLTRSIERIHAQAIGSHARRGSRGSFGMERRSISRH